MVKEPASIKDVEDVKDRVGVDNLGSSRGDLGRQHTVEMVVVSGKEVIPQIPIIWPTSYACHYLSMEYFQEPAPATTDNSDEDSPIRDYSPSSAAPAVPLIQLEAHKQLSPLWQACMA